jgi:hypothetical protein
VKAPLAKILPRTKLVIAMVACPGPREGGGGVMLLYRND